jgi:hypothetical protein
MIFVITSSIENLEYTIERRNFEFWDKLVIKNHVENQVTKEEKDKYKQMKIIGFQ